MIASPRIATPAAFLVTFLLLAVANLDALGGLARLWVSGGHEYGLIVLVVCCWLLWRCRPALAAAERRPDWRGLMVLGVLCAGMALAYLVDVRIAQLVLFVISIGALVWTLYGAAALRIVLYPLALLFLTLPVWNYLRPLLQYITVHATVLGLKLTGVPVYADKTFIHTPRGAFLVLGECSGTQFFQAGLVIGAIYAYLGFRRPLYRLVMVGAFVGMSLVGNWIRVYALVFLGRLTEFQHFMVGWGLFAVLMALVFWFGLYLQRREETLDRRAAPVALRVSAPPRKPAYAGGLVGMAAICAVLVVGGPVAARLAMSANADALGMVGLEPFAAREPWLGPYPADKEWLPAFQHAQFEALAAYRIEGGEVTTYQAYYGHQKQGFEVINELNRVYDAARWRPRGGYTGTDYGDVALEGGGSLQVIETRLEDVGTGAQRLVWHWYRVGGQDVVRPWRAKVAQLRGLVDGRPDALVVAVSTPAHDLAAARALLGGFVAAHLEFLSRAALSRERSP